MDELNELDIKISELEDRASDLEDSLFARRRKDGDLADAIRRSDSPEDQRRMQDVRIVNQAEIVSLTSQLQFVNGQLDEIGRQFREKKALQPDWASRRDDDEHPSPPKPTKPKR